LADPLKGISSRGEGGYAGSLTPLLHFNPLPLAQTHPPAARKGRKSARGIITQLGVELMAITIVRGGRRVEKTGYVFLGPAFDLLGAPSTE
jgi:hypothetical protein